MAFYLGGSTTYSGRVIDIADLSLLAAALLVWVALVHVVVAMGVRLGELVWSGRYPRLLIPSLRWRSFIYAVLLVLSAWVVGAYGGAFARSPVPDAWMMSAGWAVMAFLSFAAIYCIARGSRWERLLFLPITLFGAALAGWLTFA